MTPKAISDFIRQHPSGPKAGAEAFKQLPR
jgi:hypothetical protein